MSELARMGEFDMVEHRGPHPVVIDTDPGIDDALAIVLALRSPELRVELMTTVAGNTGLRAATDNARRLLALLDPAEPPRLVRGAARPLRGRLNTAPDVHGDDGLAGLSRLRDRRGRLLYPASRGPAPAGSGAAEAIVAKAREHGEALTVVALGPLTNIARALEADEPAMHRVGRLIVMGGAIEAPGNVTAVAEFNFHVDPVAADRVLASGMRITLVSLDVTRQVRLRWSVVRDALRGDRPPLARALRHFTRTWASSEAGMPLHDPLATALAIDPGLVRTRPLPVRVETRGVLTRGMSIADRRARRQAAGSPSGGPAAGTAGDATRGTTGDAIRSAARGTAGDTASGTTEDVAGETTEVPTGGMTGHTGESAAEDATRTVARGAAGDTMDAAAGAVAGEIVETSTGGMSTGPIDGLTGNADESAAGDRPRLVDVAFEVDAGRVLALVAERVFGAGPRVRGRHGAERSAESGADVVVIGSANTDLTITLPALPRPGETVTGGTLHTGFGGKGANQAVAARRAGAEVAFATRMGDDEYADRYLDHLWAEGIDTGAIGRDRRAASGVALIVVDAAGRNQIAVASGANARLRPAHLKTALRRVRAGGVVVAQLEVPIDTVEAAFRAARRVGASTLLNPAPVPIEESPVAAGDAPASSSPRRVRRLPGTLVGLTDVVVVNAIEAEQLAGLPVDGLAPAHRAAQALVAAGFKAAVVTLGERGAVWTDGTSAGHAAAPAVEAVDTTGVGDTFTGYLAAGLARGAQLAESVAEAVRAAALAVTRRGAQPGVP